MRTNVISANTAVYTVSDIHILNIEAKGLNFRRYVY